MMLKSPRDRRKGVNLIFFSSQDLLKRDTIPADAPGQCLGMTEQIIFYPNHIEPNGAFLCMEGNRSSIVTQSADFGN
jgi:hypothetical protein